MQHKNLMGRWSTIQTSQMHKEHVKDYTWPLSKSKSSRDEHLDFLKTPKAEIAQCTKLSWMRFWRCSKCGAIFTEEALRKSQSNSQAKAFYTSNSTKSSQAFHGKNLAM